MRLAAAKVYSCNIGDETVGDRCIENLRSLFSDESEDVRNKAALCFSYLEEEDLREFSEVIRAYVQSPAFPSQHDCLLRCLEKSVNQLPDLTVELARKFIAVAGDDLSAQAFSGGARACAEAR